MNQIQNQNQTTLKEIEESLKLLWTQRLPREEFSRGRMPEGVHPQIADQIDIKGVNIYASLIRNGQNDLMESVYPICSHLIGKGFESVVASYYEISPPAHFNFNRGAERFSLYLKDHGDRYTKKYPFLSELADYEWLELEVMEHPGDCRIEEDVSLDNPDVFEKFAPIVNPALVVRKYQYPIAKIVEWVRDGVKLPRRVKKDPSIQAVFRSPTTNDVKFLELEELACKVLESAIESPSSYNDLIKLVLQESPNSDPQETVLKFLELVEKLRELEVFVGSRKI